jgi:hypothetical protein
MATRKARPPWLLGRQDQGRRSWACIHFNGAAAGQAGVIATLQENATELDRIVTGFGWSLADESVELMYRSPVVIRQLTDDVEAGFATCDAYVMYNVRSPASRAVVKPSEMGAATVQSPLGSRRNVWSKG